MRSGFSRSHPLVVATGALLSVALGLAGCGGNSSGDGQAGGSSVVDWSSKGGSERVGPTRESGSQILAPTSPRSPLARRELEGTLARSPDGSLLEVAQQGAAGRFLVSMLATRAAALVPRPGWSITRVGSDPGWTPARCGAMPNTVIGTRWFAMFDAITDSADPLGTGVASGAPVAKSPGRSLQLVVYDLEARTYRNLLAEGGAIVAHSLSLRAEGDHGLSFLYSGAAGDGTAPTRSGLAGLRRRVIDLRTDTFEDRTIAVPSGWTVGGIFRANGELRADVRDVSGQQARTGRVVVASDGGGRIDLLPTGSGVPPVAVDGFRVRVDYSPETPSVADDFDAVVNASGAVVHRFPHDRFGQVLLRRVIGETVFVSFRSIDPGGSTDNLGVVDLTLDRVDAAFAPSAPDLKLSPDSADLFIAGVQRLSP